MPTNVKKSYRLRRHSYSSFNTCNTFSYPEGHTMKPKENKIELQGVLSRLFTPWLNILARQWLQKKKKRQLALYFIFVTTRDFFNYICACKGWA